MSNSLNLKQYDVRHYAGSEVNRPASLPFGDYYFSEDTEILYKYNYNGEPIQIGGAGGGTTYQRAETFSSLPSGLAVGDLAYINTSEGTAWLPGTMGGSYYPAGWYVWNGTVWNSDRNSIANQFQTNINSINTKVDKVVGYVLSKNDLTDILKTSYDSTVSWITTNGANLINHLTNTNNPHSVTKTQVGLGNVDNTSDVDKPLSTASITALSSKVDVVAGERLINASEITKLVNTAGINTGDQDIIFEVQDEGSLVSTSISKLNFVGAGITATDLGSGVAQITVTATGGGAAHTVTDYRSSYESIDGKIYDGYLLDTVITITRELDGTIEQAQNLTNLEIDWTNRLTLTYI